MIAALARRAIWRTAFAATGGLRVAGRLPDQPCVLVANHSSHADTAALLAALPARRCPSVAAAADYWFRGPARRLICRALVGAFPVRRHGGGTADLAHAGDLLAAGHDVIVYPEGSRSRDGSIGEFRSGAAQLARLANAPLVPVGIGGTRELLPVHGRLRRAPVSVRIGDPLLDASTARAAVAHLAADPAEPPAHRDSRLRQRVEAFASSPAGLVAVGLWAFGEALIFPIIPEFVLVVLGLAAPRRVIRLALVAAAASVAGGALMYTLAAHGASLAAPLTTPRMHDTAQAQFATESAAAVRHQTWSGIPYKVYGAAAGQAQVGSGPFAAESVAARGLRMVLVAALIGLVAVALRRWRRHYPVVLIVFVTVFAAGLTAVVQIWS